MSTHLRLALAQMAMDGDSQVNLSRSLALLDKAAQAQADLVLFPESQFSPYFPQFQASDAAHGGSHAAQRYLATLDDPLIIALQRRCRELGVAATCNVYLTGDAGNTSSTMLIGSNGQCLAVAHKMHITCVPQFYEQDYFAPDLAGFPVVDLGSASVGVVICYDRHYPESIRICALQGADLVLVPTANTFDEAMEMFEWEMRIAAFQNTLFIAMCNRVGQEHVMTFAGASLVVGPDGEMLARAGAGEELLVVDLDLSRVAESRSRRPYLDLRNRRLTELLAAAEGGFT